MDCLISVGEPNVEVTFKCKKENQKYLIEIILAYSNLDHIELAELLGVNVLMLNQVITGAAFLSGQTEAILTEIFCMLLGD